MSQYFQIIIKCNNLDKDALTQIPISILEMEKNAL